MKTLIIIFILMSFNTFAQETIIVSNDKSGDYTSIQKAISKSKKGTSILVKKGTYIENIIMRDDITLRGEDNPIIDGGNKGVVIKAGNNCVISGFIITKSGSESGVNDCGILADNVNNVLITNNLIAQNGHYGVIIRKSDVKIQNNLFLNNSLLAIYLAEGAKFEISNNLFINHSHSALDVAAKDVEGKFYNNTIDIAEYGVIYGNYLKEPLPIEIYNNIFYQCANAIYCTTIFAEKIEYNVFYNNERNYWNWDTDIDMNLPKTNIISDPLFIDTDDFNYSISSNSPCIKAGRNSEDIGALSYEIDTHDETTLTMSGIAINVCVNKSAKIKTTLIKEADNTYTLKGEFDNKNLFGVFDIKGKKLPYAYGEGVLTMQFEGEIYFGGSDGSGFPANTHSTFVVTLIISITGVTGTYHVGKILPYVDFDQYGTIELYYE